jgi:hypothetical protein
MNARNIPASECFNWISGTGPNTIPASWETWNASEILGSKHLQKANMKSGFVPNAAVPSVFIKDTA